MDKPLGGLFLMSLLTIVWVLIGEFNLKGRDYYFFGIIFTLLIAYFIANYLKLNRQNKQLPKSEIPSDPRKEKLYWVVFIAEGVAIPVVNTILVNINMAELFIPCFALIVGLHFFPLAKVFSRKFDYYTGAWTTSVALVGIALSIWHIAPQFLINTVVSFGCAIATSLYALNMMSDAKKILKENLGEI